MNKVFNIAFRAGISGFLALLAMGLLLGGIEQIQSPKKSEPFLIVFQFGALLAALVWLSGTVLLWIEGWIFILQGWRTRSRLLSSLLVIVLLFFNALAAYCFHILRKRQLEKVAVKG
jgi:undecaprenyl pyrophosphate phosphatase UppP